MQAKSHDMHNPEAPSSTAERGDDDGWKKVSKVKQFCTPSSTAQFHKMHNAKVPSSTAERDDDAPADTPRTLRPTDGDEWQSFSMIVFPKVEPEQRQ
jgi:hypothetical protein